MLDPTGKYKEVNVNKLTTIIRLVITCLESRYVQKVNNQSIQEDIKSLEARLGKIAFENKMSLSLGISSSSVVPEEDKEWAWIDEFIKKSTDDATVRLLQFMFGMNHARLDKAVKSLMQEQKMWNNLIICIYEISNLEKKQAIIKGMNDKAGTLGGNMTINIQHLDRKHHRVALTDFCDTCNASNVKLRRMTLREECAIDFIKDVTLPSLKFLIFLEMNVNEDQFVSIITSLTYRKCSGVLQFIKSSVPDELKEEAKQTVESALKGLDMKCE
ncbi:hypothetical protein BSL78_09905 [Apostichopus japonicus]|uniref:Uncharacterized protein n=1 Tax=Stichopus japonicus TaxID=307972 RepID=A0A2G8KYZ5_STIJA|nr:hypothetical protein BSL78_09905 [Apostichopus japonicus]